MRKLLDWIAGHMVAWLVGSALLVIVSAVVIMVEISRSYRVPAGEEQPKVTDWMQAWGSIGGVLAGLAAAGAALALLHFERTRAIAAERQLAEDRAEAALELARAVVVSGPSWSVINTGGLKRIAVRVRNLGPSPITNVAATATLPGEAQPFVFRPVEVLKAHDEVTLELSYSELWQLSAPEELNQHSGAVTVYFADSSGRRWRREGGGQPQRWIGPYELGQ